MHGGYAGNRSFRIVHAHAPRAWATAALRRCSPQTLTKKQGSEGSSHCPKLVTKRWTWTANPVRLKPCSGWLERNLPCQLCSRGKPILSSLSSLRARVSGDALSPLEGSAVGVHEGSTKFTCCLCQPIGIAMGQRHDAVFIHLFIGQKCTK